MTAAADDGGRTWDVVVVGGGVGGLVAAREAARAGRRTLVLEARDRVGGVVAAHTVDGLVLDAGAESFATRGGAVEALARGLGLGEDLVRPTAPGSWVHGPWGDGPLPRTGLLGIPGHPLAADVRGTLGLGGALRAGLDLVLPARVGAGATSLGALVRARQGRRVLDRLVAPVVGGVHAADPSALALDAVTPGLAAARAAARSGSLARAVRAQRASAPAGSAVLGLAGGLHRLVDALVADLLDAGGVVRTQAQVTALRLAAGGPGAELVVAGDRAATTTDGVVLASAAAAGLLVGAGLLDEAPGTDEGSAIALVTLVVDAPALDAAPRGTGVLVARGSADVRAKALTHATAKWAWAAAAAGPGRHVLRLSYGHAEDDPTTAPDGDLVAQARADAAVLLGVPLAPGTVRDADVVRWTQALPRPGAAHRDAVARVRDAVAGRPDVALVGAWVAGNGLASVVPQARAAGRSLAGENAAGGVS
ncbi:protoporphyrinogen oxidase [Cellulomonas endophytica]|uniref:protoporphyrinogen oxidase n=1 Tax=Cellulomonas endophytica TaxID=2494735 RepID=UPI001011F24E|nr:protoporphyrinogen oxidase [Cellulomonas endophytica]